jgi:hypothetical protein
MLAPRLGPRASQLLAVLANAPGRVLALTLIAPVFYLFVTPLRVLLRRRAFDARRNAAGDSYWMRSPRPHPDDLRRPY